MIYLKVKENSAQAKAFLQYIRTMPFIEVIEKSEIPNDVTKRAIREANGTGLKRHKNVKSLMTDLLGK